MQYLGAHDNTKTVYATMVDTRGAEQVPDSCPAGERQAGWHSMPNEDMAAQTKREGLHGSEGCLPPFA